MRSMGIVSDFWIGLNDIASEDDWIWVNGQRANTSRAGFSTARVIDWFNLKNCAEVKASGPNEALGLITKAVCSARNYGLCEKQTM